MSPRGKKIRATAHTSEVVVPDRLYFRIGEVSELLEVPAYVLRFWETEFPALAPKKSSTGQRMYRRKDVENLLEVKHLLYEEGFTIAGAKQHMRQSAKPGKGQHPLPLFSASHNHKNELKHLRAGLKEILQILSKKR
jgi:DNA-binding transcriptional MerR regulator